MANHYFGIDVPGARNGIGNVSTGTSTTSKNVELVVLDGVTGRSKEELIEAVEAIKMKIIAGDEPA
jgi:hypothetical protein